MIPCVDCEYPATCEFLGASCDSCKQEKLEQDIESAIHNAEMFAELE
jgi:hypothetical protein